MTTLNVGIIGTGMIAHGAHAEAFGAVKGVKVLAACDTDRPRLEAFAGKYHIPKLYTDYEKLVADDELEAVSVALPVFLHAPASIAALQAGKHVLCEKPMARNGAEAQAMVDAAKRARRKLAIYYRRRFSRDAVMAKRLIDQGKLGKVYYARSIQLRWRGRPGFDRGMAQFGKWFTRKKEAGGGPLMDLGGYDLDLMLGLLDFPKVKSCAAVTFQEIDQERARREGFDLEDLGVGIVRLRDGRALFLESSFAGNIDEPTGFWFFGSLAGLRLGPLTIFRDRAGRKHAREIDCSHVRTTSAVRQFVDAIRNDEPIAISSGEQALLVTRIQDALYRSAEIGHEVPYE